MTLYVLDTDHLTLFRYGHAAVTARVDATPADQLATTIVTIEEQLTGWYTLLRKCKRQREIVVAYEQLAESVLFLSTLPIFAFSDGAAEIMAELRKQKIRISTLDLRIASIALANDAVVVTRNLQHFSKVPGLQIEDWSAT